MSKNVNAIIDGIKVTVPAETTIYDAAVKAGIKIPTLCYHPDLPPTGGCGLCVVEIDGAPNPKRSCCTPVWDGMEVKTSSNNLRQIRKTLLELILSNHEVKCPTCVANEKCELQALANSMGVNEDRFMNLLHKQDVDENSFSIVRDPNKCIQCGRCITVCNEIQTVYALTFVNRGAETEVNTAFSKGMADSPCVNCGQCTVFCPTGALREKTETEQVWDALLDPTKHVVVQEAPAIRATIGEEFGMDVGTLSVGKMYSALKKLGFDRVFDTNFTADLTILEEGTELVNRVKEGGTLPLITSCSPGWIKFMETYFPDFAENASTAKSPQQMFGTLVKTYYAKKAEIDPKDIVSVSIMPCTAKKYEARRPEMSDSGYQDVDFVLTTRELARMIKEAGIDFKNLEEGEADSLMGEYTGAATIFGATGGVMEAAVRSAYFLITNEELENVDLEVVRGMQGIKEAEVDVKGLKVKVAVAHGLGNARELLEKVQKQIKETGKSDYHFIEIMACPGGCVGGGGQPFGSNFAARARRGEALYREDKSLTLRKSHANPSITKIYEDFLGAPGSEVAHKLLHTHYFERCVKSGEAVKQITGHDH